MIKVQVTAKFRAEQLRYYVGRAKALESEEKQLHLRLHESLRSVLKKEKTPSFQGNSERCSGG